MAKTDPFASYQMPLGLVNGVKIPLPGTDATFTVLLPGTMNEAFNMNLMAKMNMTPDEDGKVRVNSAMFQRARKELFFSDCILDATGLPAGMDAGAFFAKYALAARTIYDRATELAVLADDEAIACLGKYETTSNGSHSGGEEQSNTTRLSKAG